LSLNQRICWSAKATDDYELTSRAETDAFQEKLGGDTNVPPGFISPTENVWMGVKPWALAA